MYDELVKMLRVCGDSNNSCANCPVRENDGSCPHGEWEFAAEWLAEKVPRWIPVTERLPELHDAEYLDEVTGEMIRYKESKPIMIWLEKGGFMDIGIYEKSDAVDDFCYQGVPATVTYWHPLPEPPKEG